MIYFIFLTNVIFESQIYSLHRGGNLIGLQSWRNFNWSHKAYFKHFHDQSLNNRRVFPLHFQIMCNQMVYLIDMPFIFKSSTNRDHASEYKLSRKSKFFGLCDQITKTNIKLFHKQKFFQFFKS